MKKMLIDLRSQTKEVKILAKIKIIENKVQIHSNHKIEDRISLKADKEDTINNNKIELMRGKKKNLLIKRKMPMLINKANYKIERLEKKKN